MEHGDGERAAKRAEPSASATADGGGEEDLLSALPDDVLLHILARLRSAAFAARTSALSSRWRRLWALLPTLEFCPLDVYRIGPALAAHEAEARATLLCLRVFLWEANAASVAAWIPAAARRLSGSLTLVNSVDDWEADGGVFELPCFENATSIRLGLGFLGIAVPASEDPCVLGEALSTPHCPSLRRLTVWNARGHRQIHHAFRVSAAAEAVRSGGLRAAHSGYAGAQRVACQRLLWSIYESGSAGCQYLGSGARVA
ncbi:uncharacterized protein LOC112270704 [Brachypodium distachyon]|uniref:uncharacterized protein LOC112270704 n=1 Tax=Brachypodium distachyon TaxID=15368 RepID=UPI000D0D315D|nr:uncharacterized protein LOC112270704 [Brachypodium distachyon]|eukprot:XP_024314503.1 uncharacterized protein LOC112270704 [Brachypodium distachyon]